MTTSADATEWVKGVREYCEKATKGPWTITEDCEGVRTITGPGTEEIFHEPTEVRGYSSCTIVTPLGMDGNLEFASRARTDLPKALALIDSQAAELRECRELLRAIVPDKYILGAGPDELNERVQKQIAHLEAGLRESGEGEAS